MDAPAKYAQIYDYVLTLPSEIILVWSGPWGPGKALFLLTRYMTWPEVVLAVYRTSHCRIAARLRSHAAHFPYRADGRYTGSHVPCIFHVLRMYAVHLVSAPLTSPTPSISQGHFSGVLPRLRVSQ